jgi:hypothetical protein
MCIDTVAPDADGEPDEHSEDHEGHGWVADGDGLRERGETGTIENRIQAGRPDDQAAADRDDQRVQRIAQVIVAAALPGQRPEREDEARVGHQPAAVHYRRKRQDPAGQQRVRVVRNVGRAGQQHPAGKGEPRKAGRALGARGGDEAGNDRRKVHDVEQRSLPDAGLRQEEVDTDGERPDQQDAEPGRGDAGPRPHADPLWP